MGTHSDVDSTAYNSAFVIFWYEGLVPTLLIRRLSLIKTSGLFKWWPNFINRRDLKVGGDQICPTSPTMTGNILVLFLFLGGGLALSTVSFLLNYYNVFLIY